VFYTDAEYGFSIEFPDEWTNTPGHVSSFERKRIIFSPVRPSNSEDKVKGGELNIAVATRGFIPDPHKRERQMVSFVKTKNFFSFNWGQRVYTLAKKLDSEPNTAWVETKISYGGSKLPGASSKLLDMIPLIPYNMGIHKAIKRISHL
jgi:hypothetical protein